MTGYQAGIIYAIGSNAGDGRISVRSVDRWYCDVVQPLFGTAVYSQPDRGRDKIQYVVKGTRAKLVDLRSISDAVGFCRAYIELHGILDRRPAKDKRGNKIRTLRLRVYGREEVMEFLMENLPAGLKKMQHISNLIDGVYNGETCAIYYQSRKEILKIMDYIDGEPRNEKIWESWVETIS